MTEDGQGLHPEIQMYVWRHRFHNFTWRTFLLGFMMRCKHENSTMELSWATSTVRHFVELYQITYQPNVSHPALVEKFVKQGVYEGLEGISKEEFHGLCCCWIWISVKPEMIDAIVQQRVAEELKSHMSQKLLQELEEIHKEIEQVKHELQNSYVTSLGTVIGLSYFP